MDRFHRVHTIWREILADSFHHLNLGIRPYYTRIGFACYPHFVLPESMPSAYVLAETPKDLHGCFIPGSD